MACLPRLRILLMLCVRQRGAVLLPLLDGGVDCAPYLRPEQQPVDLLLLCALRCTRTHQSGPVQCSINSLALLPVAIGRLQLPEL